MPRQIQLTKQSTQPDQSSGAVRLVVTAVGTSVANEIFKYYRKPLNAQDGTGVLDRYVGICTPADLQTLPLNAPDNNSNGYFRKSTLDKTFNTAVEAATAWTDIQDFTERLIDILNAADTLSPSSVVTIS